MDPLIRKVNGNNEIEGLNIGINGECIDKVCRYAEDIFFSDLTSTVMLLSLLHRLTLAT